jgi:perosamine synthetase
MKYMVAAPNLSGAEEQYVLECLRTNWISSRGRFITDFEARVASATQRKYAIATCNGTVALHLALLGLDLKAGDEVVLPSLTYVATANAVAYCGATPVFADSDPDTWCVSPDSVARLVTPRTRGIIPVHLYGHPSDMDPLLQLADEHGLWVVEDCAEAQGATYEGRPVGSCGTAGMFSFFGNKIVTTGEGGMLVTDDPDLADRYRLLRGQGMDPVRRYWHPVIGFNYRMTNVQAAIGLAQMERIDQLVGDRKRVAGWYRERLAGIAGLRLPGEAKGVENVFWLYSVLVRDNSVRDLMMAELAEAGIETRPFFHPIHTFPMYRHCHTDNGCPVACDLSGRGINLPTSSYLMEHDIDVIAAALRERLVAIEARRAQAARTPPRSRAA